MTSTLRRKLARITGPVTPAQVEAAYLHTFGELPGDVTHTGQIDSLLKELGLMGAGMLLLGIDLRTYRATGQVTLLPSPNLQPKT